MAVGKSFAELGELMRQKAEAGAGASSESAGAPAQERETVTTVNEQGVARERDVDSLERTLDTLAAGLKRSREHENIDRTHDQLRSKNSADRDDEYAALYGKINAFRHRINTLKGNDAIDQHEFQKLRTELAGLTKTFRNRRFEEPRPGPEPEPIPDQTRDNWLVAKAEAAAAGATFSNEYQKYYQSLHSNKWKAAYQSAKSFGRDLFGFRPKLPPELETLQEKEIAAQKKYLQSAARMQSPSGVGGEKRAQRYEKFKQKHEAAAVAAGVGKLEDALVAEAFEKRESALIQRYLKQLDYATVLKRMEERQVAQEKIIAEQPKIKSLETMRAVLASRPGIALRVGLFGAVGLVTGGASGAAGAVAGVAGGIGGGLLSRLGYDAGFTNRARQTKEATFTKMVNAIDPSQLEQRRSEVLEALFAVRSSERRRDVASTFGAMAGGGIVGGIAEAYVPSASPDTVPPLQVTDTPEVVDGSVRPEARPDNLVPSAGPEIAESVPAPEIPQVDAVAPVTIPGAEIPVAVDTPAAVDSVGVPETVPTIQNVVPNPEQYVTIPETGSIDTISEAMYQQYCDGELVGLPEGMERNEFLGKMYQAFAELDNNPAIMDRMDLPNQLTSLGDVDKVLPGQAINVTPIIEHMNGADVDAIETGLYPPEDALAREGETPRTTAPTESPRPSVRPVTN